jgi:putative copper export protein
MALMRIVSFFTALSLLVLVVPSRAQAPNWHLTATVGYFVLAVTVGGHACLVESLQ